MEVLLLLLLPLLLLLLLLIIIIIIIIINTHQRGVECWAIDTDTRVGVLVSGRVRGAINANPRRGEARVRWQSKPRRVVLAGADGLARYRVGHDGPPVLTTRRSARGGRCTVTCRAAATPWGNCPSCHTATWTRTRTKGRRCSRRGLSGHQ